MIKAPFFIACLGLTLGVGANLQAADPTDTAPVSVDDSKMNRADSAAAPTADQASNSKTDVQIMAQIRRAIVKDKALSVYAHNVKVISQNGNVDLKGVVHTQDEKDSIGSKASAVVGDGHVTNEITVKGS